MNQRKAMIDYWTRELRKALVLRDRDGAIIADPNTRSGTGAAIDRFEKHRARAAECKAQLEAWQAAPTPRRAIQ